MNTCRTCKYWGKDNPSECDLIALDDGPIKHTGAYIDANACDDSGLYARLVTGPDFGCTLHVPKNKKAK